MRRVIPSAYHHEQTTAASTWTIQHNLGGSGSLGVPIVDVMIDFDGELVKINPDEIEYIDANNIEINFSAARTGRATIIV